MRETVWMRRDHKNIELPRKQWEDNFPKVAYKMSFVLKFMSEEHHLVRNFAVRELPRVAEPIWPELIAKKLRVPSVRINAIIDELEKGLTFLVRNKQGAIEWAFPFTVAQTPHHLTFSTGERINAA